jgi:hypothetical protein
MIRELFLDADELKGIGLSILVAGIAIYSMARASRRGALNWKRATAILLLASLAIFVASAAVLIARGGPYSVMHGGSGIADFIALMIIQVLLPLPAWLVAGTIIAVILGLRSSMVIADGETK